MKLGLRYATTYRYAEAVGFSPHELRLFPRPDRFGRVRRVSLQTNEDAVVRYARDVFDNTVAICFYPQRLRELRFALEINLDLEERDPFDFILESDAVEMPFAYANELSGVLAPFLKRQTSAALVVPGWTPPNGERCGTVSALVQLNHALHAAICYERREEGAAFTPEETLRLGRGACRDVSLLLAEVLRAAGLAARLVSGYLRATDEQTHRAEGSLHAWTEVFLPGAGWVGMDPTNGVLCNHNWIAAAVGLTPGQITPVAGAYYHDQGVPSEMTSRLELINL